MNYSIYPNILTTKSDIIINGSQLRDIIMSDEMKRRVDIVRTASDAQRHELKKFLPNINVNGTFSHRADDGIKEYNGITALDFDHIPENEMQDIKDKLKQNPYTCFMFESPSDETIQKCEITAASILGLEAPLITRGEPVYTRRNVGKRSQKPLPAAN